MYSPNVCYLSWPWVWRINHISPEDERLTSANGAGQFSMGHRAMNRGSSAPPVEQDSLSWAGNLVLQIPPTCLIKDPTVASWTSYRTTPTD